MSQNLPPPNVPLNNPDGTLNELWRRYFLAQSTDVTGAAPTDAPYVTFTTNADLTNPRNLGLLTTGYLKLTVALGAATPVTVATVPTTDLSGTLQAAQWPATLFASSGVNLTGLTGANVTHSVVSKVFADSGYVALGDQTVLVTATGGATTIKLPATATAGVICTVKKVDASANAVTVDGNGHTIDGAASVSLGTQWKAVRVQGDGTNWAVIGTV
jgi:hypothetical protein